MNIFYFRRVTSLGAKAPNIVNKQLKYNEFMVISPSTYFLVVIGIYGQCTQQISCQDKFFADAKPVLGVLDMR